MTKDTMTKDTKLGCCIAQVRRTSIKVFGNTSMINQANLCRFVCLNSGRIMFSKLPTRVEKLRNLGF